MPLAGSAVPRANGGHDGGCTATHGLLSRAPRMGRASRRHRAVDDVRAPSTLSPIRMDGWRQQAMLSHGRSLPDVDSGPGRLHPKLRELVERKVPSRLPAVKKSAALIDPVERRQAITHSAKELLKKDAKYRPSPWARSVAVKAEKRGRASEDHENVSAPWRHGYNANDTQHVGMGKDLLSADAAPSDASRPAQANACRNYSLYVTYKNWLGPTCYTPMPSTRGSLSTRGALYTAGSNVYLRGSSVTPSGLGGTRSAGSAV